MAYPICSNTTNGGLGDTMVALSPRGQPLWSYKDPHTHSLKIIGTDVVIWNGTGLIAFDRSGAIDRDLPIGPYVTPQANSPSMIRDSRGHMAVVQGNSIYLIGNVEQATDVNRLFLTPIMLISAVGILFTVRVGRRVR